MDLQETKFVDLRNKDTINFISPATKDVISQLPTSSSQKQIPFKIYEGTKKYNLDKYKLEDKKTQERIDLIIKIYIKGLHQCLSTKDNKALKTMIQPLINQIKTGCELGNPQCCFIGFICFSTRIMKQFCSIEYGPSLLYQNNCNYPLNTIQLGIYEFKMDLPNWRQYFQQAISYGCAEAFIFYGSSLRQLNDYQGAYQMYKNAEHFGLKGVANLYLGKLFAIGGPNFPKNPEKSIQCYQKSLELNILMDQENLYYYDEIKNYYKVEEEKLSNIKTTQLTQAMVISNFIFSKMKEQKYDFKYHFGSTNNFVNDKSSAVIKKPKQFYVVFSPTMNYPSRMFLGRDQAGLIEHIAIYGWEKIPVKKLKLLHKLGTKVVLYQYIRKIGSNDNLPLYRVQNPDKVQILAMPSKKQISTQELRLFAKILFQKGQYEKCLPIYKFLLRRKCHEQEVIYCNIGLTYLRMQRQKEAAQEFHKSIVIKKNLKAQFNLVNCLINQRQFKEAKIIIEQMEECDKKQQVKKKLIEKQKQSSSQTNMKALIQSINKKQRYLFRNQQFSKILSGSNSFNIREIQGYLFFNHNLICNLLQFSKNSFKTQQQYLKKLQNIIEIPQIKTQQINSKNGKQFRQYFALAYGLTRNDPNNFDIQIIFKLRSMTLEKKIQDYAILMETQNNFSEAIDICKTGQGFSFALCIRLANLYRKKNLHRQSIKIAVPMLKFLINNLRSVQDQFYFARLNLQILKCKRFLQEIDLQMINQTNKILEQSANKSKQTKKKLNFQNFQMYHQFMKEQMLIDSSQYIERLTKTRIKIEIERILLLQSLKNYTQAQLIISEQLKFIETKLKTDRFYQEYCEIVILKLKIGNKSQKMYNIQQSIQSIFKKIAKLNKNAPNKFNIQAYKKIILKQSLIILFKTKQYKLIINICEQSIQINQVNLTYIFDYLKRYCMYHYEDLVIVINSIKKSLILNQIQQDLFDDIRQWLIKSENDKFTNSVRQYFRLDEKQDYEHTLFPIQKQQQQEEEQEIFYKQWNMLEHQKWIDAQNIEKQFAQVQYDEIDGYICNFEDTKGIIYVVIFDPVMFIPAQLYKKFKIAATKICPQNKGKNGIKFMKNGDLRLKINAGARLKGKIVKKLKVSMCIFDELERHDSYKRK